MNLRDLLVSHEMPLADFGPGWCHDPDCPDRSLGRHIHPYPANEVGIVVPDEHHETYQRLIDHGSLGLPKPLSFSQLRTEQLLADRERGHVPLTDEQIKVAMQAPTLGIPLGAGSVMRLNHAEMFRDRMEE